MIVHATFSSQYMFPVITLPFVEIEIPYLPPIFSTINLTVDIMQLWDEFEKKQLYLLAESYHVVRYQYDSINEYHSEKESRKLLANAFYHSGIYPFALKGIEKNDAYNMLLKKYKYNVNNWGSAPYVTGINYSCHTKQYTLLLNERPVLSETLIHADEDCFIML
jgi:hypothetical protein